MASNPKQISDVKKKTTSSTRNMKPEQSNSGSSQQCYMPDSNDLIKEVIEAMDCPICMEYLQAPIFMCETGHNICGDCKNGLLLPVCPMCKNSISGHRNFALESISAKMCIPCCNISLGCTVKCPPNKMEEHNLVCKFKPFECPLNDGIEKCYWTGLPKELAKHFETEHPNNCNLKPGQEVIFSNFNINMPDKDLQLISYNNTYFLYHVEINVEDKIAYWALQMVGTDKEAIKWRCDFAFYNNKLAKYINVSEKCLPYTVGLKKAIEDGTCVGIPLKVIENFLHPNKNFTFKFFVKPVVASSNGNYCRFNEKKPFNKDLRYDKSHAKDNDFFTS